MQSLSKRGEEVLSSLISAFTSDGCAVGSATLAKYLGNRFSSATIRNIMGDLERIGLLTHKHTSGGRIPTEEGIRYYVDRLLKIESLPEGEISDIRSRYQDRSYNVANVFRKTSEILSRLSSYAGLVVAPLVGEVVIKQMEFITLSKDRILGVFVGRDGQVENRIINIDHKFTYSDLEKINNYCNRAFYGLTLSEARDKVAKELYETKREYDDMIRRALLLSQDMLLDIENTELFVEGGSQLLSMPEFIESEKAGSLMDVLEEKRNLIDLLNNALESDSVNVFIGSESGYDAISGCSVVSASYKKTGKVLGTLGVIGPTRMNYSKVIPVVDCTAKLMSDFLDGEWLHER